MREIQFDFERILLRDGRDLQGVVFPDETEGAAGLQMVESDHGAVFVDVYDGVFLFVIGLWREGDVLHDAIRIACDGEFAEIDGTAWIGWAVQKHAAAFGFVKTTYPNV